MSFWEKMKLSASGLAGVLDDVELTEEDLAELRESDAITDLMQGLGEAMPVLKTVLIDERDAYLASKISDAPGKNIVAVVGAGHVKGMVDHLENKREVDLKEIEKIPPSSPVFKWIGWAVPVLILGAILAIGITQGAQAAGDNALYWFLANAVPCAIGAILAFAHPATIASSFIAAPFTSLTPVIGAGYVAAFVQAYVQPPVVREFKTVNEDIGRARNWWTNHLLRIFLVFILTSLGSIVGTYVGGFEIFSNLF
jgi:pheromone shutdown-related protein TraB